MNIKDVEERFEEADCNRVVENGTDKASVDEPFSLAGVGEDRNDGCVDEESNRSFE